MCKSNFIMNYLLIATFSMVILINCSSKENRIVGTSIIKKDSNRIEQRAILFHRFYIKENNRFPPVVLDTIRNGFDSLQIRLWIENGVFDHRELYVLKSQFGEWKGNYYRLNVDTNYGNGKGSDSFLRGPIPFDVAEFKHLQPTEHSWTKFIDSLLALKIKELPDISEINGMNIKWTHPTGYTVEYADKRTYRLYSYDDPEEFTDEFWQASTMIKIVNLFESGLKKVN